MNLNLTVEKREGGAAEEVRKQNLIPAVVYGQGIPPVSLSMSYGQFVKLYDTAGESSLIDLSIGSESEPRKVIIQDVQYNPVNNKIIHVDFRQIRMDKEMEVAVAINLVGEAKAVKELGGTLFKGVDSVNVKCLPKDLIGELNVDISVLKAFTDTIHVKDLILPSAIKVMDNLDIVVAKVTPPLTEDEIKAMEESGPQSVADIEVDKPKKEEETTEAKAEKK